MYAMEDAGALEVWIYKGADAKGIYYNDDGLSYDYKKGGYECLQFEWTNATNQLVIRERKRLRTEPITMKIHYSDVLKIITYHGGDTTVSFV